MDCHNTSQVLRPIELATWLVLSFAATLLADDVPPPAAAPIAPMTATVRAMRNDAALADICIVHEVLGWAVGDRGVIWHTDDGGATWREQQSNVACHLNSVMFIDSRRGWAVGGESRQGRAGSRGIVLRTADGGTIWTEVPRLILPRLTGVKFFDPNRGIAFGESASFSPSGVFTTRDGGATWQPLTADTAGDWLAGDFLEPDAGAVAGPAGQLATLGQHQLVHSPLATASLRSFRAMRLVAPTGGWAVGDGGLLLTTHDLGRSWQTPPTDLPQTIADNFDFHAVAVQGTHVWAAGTPGTRIMHSPDDGQTWESIPTGQTTPLRALTFIDPQRGWAVGEFGNILATQDGGHTWRAQRSGGQRAALLALFAEPTDVPLELLADTGAADGYLAAVNILTTPFADSGRATHQESQRFQEALLLSGAASSETAWRFPLPAADLALSPADLLQSLNRENDGRAMQQLTSHLVRELRTWRPDVLVTQHGASDTNNPMAALTEQLVAQAVAAAADPAQHPELEADIGLAPWQVKKVYGVLPPGARGDELLATGRFSPYLGAALSDFVTPARTLLPATRTAPPDTYELKLLLSNVAENTNARGLFAGLSLAPGSEARRPQAELPTQDLEALRRLATRRRHLQELMERSDGNAAWAGQVSTMIEGLSPDDAGQLLVQLADGYRKAGRLDLAADTYFLFVRRCPDHALADQSLDWLIKFYASSEIAHRLKQTGSEPSRLGRGRSEGDSEARNPVQQASANLPTHSPTLSRDDRLRRAAQLADYLKAARPALYAEPSVRFAETSAQRELGFANPAQRFFLTLKQLPESDPWRQCASTEEWLAKPADLPPTKKLANCRPADQPPTLDGNLDDPFWTKADRMRLITDNDHAANSSPAEVQLVYDKQFLYLAIHCAKVPNLDYTADINPRPHDADLTQHDRVTLRLDTDRDYNTAFEFTVDNRGWTHDACWGDATWNPTWYVASATDDTSWTIEVAIPLTEIVDKPPTARSVWAVAARRTIPRVGYETWSGLPTSDDSPAQFGLLIFQ